MNPAEDFITRHKNRSREVLRSLLTRISSALGKHGNQQDATIFAQAADAPHPEEQPERWILEQDNTPATMFLVERGRHELTAESIV